MFANIATPEPEKRQIFKRVKQSSKPLLNKLESEFLARWERNFGPQGKLKIQAITFRLGNGVRYTPDFVDLEGKSAYEVKGPFMREDARIKLEVAAHEYSEFTWFLYWKDCGEWRNQRILP